MVLAFGCDLGLCFGGGWWLIVIGVACVTCAVVWYCPFIVVY